MTNAKEILVADDEANIVEFLTDVLSEEGYTVRCVNDGASALLATQERRPLLVLIDNAMPVMTGLEVVQRLRASGDETLPIIVMSASARPEAVLKEGANTFIHKPFTLIASSSSYRPGQ